MDVAPFAGLMTDQQNMVKVYMSVENSVIKSFQQDQNRIIVPRNVRITQSEIKRRANICWRIFRVLRGDLSWSWMRIVDHIPRFLRMELDGQDWEPDVRHSMWVPEAPIV